MYLDGFRGAVISEASNVRFVLFRVIRGSLLPNLLVRSTNYTNEHELTRNGNEMSSQGNVAVFPGRIRVALVLEQ